MAGHRSEEHPWLSGTGAVSEPAVFGKHKEVPSTSCGCKGREKNQQENKCDGLNGLTYWW